MGKALSHSQFRANKIPFLSGKSQMDHNFDATMLPRRVLLLIPATFLQKNFLKAKWQNPVQMPGSLTPKKQFPQFPDKKCPKLTDRVLN